MLLDQQLRIGGNRFISRQNYLHQFVNVLELTLPLEMSLLLQVLSC